MPAHIKTRTKVLHKETTQMNEQMMRCHPLSMLQKTCHLKGITAAKRDFALQYQTEKTRLDQKPQASAKHSRTTALQYSPKAQAASRPPPWEETMRVFTDIFCLHSEHNNTALGRWMCCSPDNNPHLSGPSFSVQSFIQAWTSLWSATEIIAANQWECTRQCFSPSAASTQQRTARLDN